MDLRVIFFIVCFYLFGLVCKYLNIKGAQEWSRSLIVSHVRPVDYLKELVSLVAMNDGLTIRIESVENESDVTVDAKNNRIIVLMEDLNSAQHASLFKVLDQFFFFSKKCKYFFWTSIISLVKGLIKLFSLIFPFLMVISFLVNNLVLSRVVYALFLLIVVGSFLSFIVNYLMDKHVCKIAKDWLEEANHELTNDLEEVMKYYDQYLFVKNLTVFYLPIEVFASMFRFLKID